MTSLIPPPAVSHAPRPWLTRNPGECAFPVGGEGWRLIACCNPSGPRDYCRLHDRVVHRAPRPSAAELERDIIAFLERRT